MRFIRGFLLACAILLLCGLMGLLALHKNGSIQTGIVIDCTPGQVWQVLTATAEYPAWNPMIARLTGELREGNIIEFTLGTGSDSMTFHPTVLRVRPAQELRWKGSMLIPGLFDGEHRFLLEKQGSQTRLMQSEEFSGLLVGRLTRGILSETTDQMIAMNMALKQRCEQRAAVAR